MELTLTSLGHVLMISGDGWGYFFCLRTVSISVSGLNGSEGLFCPPWPLEKKEGEDNNVAA